MGFFKSTKGSIVSDSFELQHDLAQFKKKFMVDVALYDDHLLLSYPLVKPPITLSYSQITDVIYTTEKEVTEKEKSVIGRAIVGGMLFGDTGATVGAISGMGTKTETHYKHYFVIEYTASSGEPASLVFIDTRMYKGRKVADTLKKLCGISDAKPETITSL